MTTKQVQLSKLSKFTNGKFLPTKERQTIGQFDVYGSNGIIAKTERCLYEKPVIVIGRVGANCGTIQRAKTASWITDNCIVSIPKDDTDFDFLFYVLKFLKLNRLAIGSAQPLLTQDILNSIGITSMTLLQQQKIGKTLSDLDTKIDNLQNQNRTLEQMAQAIFKSWFVDFDGVTEFEDSELGKIPKGWSVDKLENVCSKITDGSHFSPKEETNGVKMIGTVKNMNEHDFDFDSCKKISDEDYHKLVKNGCKAELGDILLSKDGTMGLSILYQNTVNLVLLSSIAIIKTNENFSNYYLKILLSQKNNLSVLIAGHSSGSALPRIVLKDLKTFQLLIPNNLKLKKFDNIIQHMYTEIFRNSQKIENLTKTRDALLPKLMSGEIRV